MSITAISARNQFRGKVKEFIQGPVVSEDGVGFAGKQGTRWAAARRAARLNDSR